MKLYRLSTWSHGRKFYAAGLERVEFVDRRGAGRLYTPKQAAEVRKRFRKVKLRLELEEAA